MYYNYAMKFTRLKASLAENPRPLYILTGDDKFVVDLAAQKLRGLITALPELNFSSFGGDTAAEEIAAACAAYPVMSDYRVIEVRDYGRDTAALVSYIKNPAATTVLYFISSGLDKHLSPLLGSAEIIDCSRLDEKNLLVWINKRVKDSGSQITAAAAALLVSYTNRYLARIAAETDKLISFKDGDTIAEEDVKALVTPDAEFKIYELGDAVAARDSVKALTILENLFSNTAVSSLLGMIYAHFRRLLYVAVSADSDRLSFELGVKEFAVKVAQRQAAKFTPIKLKKIVDWLSEFDSDYKSGRIGDKLGLETTVLKILNI